MGLLFVYAICGNIISFVLTTTKLDVVFISTIARAFSENYGLIFFALILNILSSIFVIYIWPKIRQRFPQSRYFKLLDKMVLFSLFFANPRNILTFVNRTFLLILVVLYGTLALFVATDLDSYLPLVAVVLVFISVLLSIFYTPAKLMNRRWGISSIH